MKKKLYFLTVVHIGNIPGEQSTSSYWDNLNEFQMENLMVSELGGWKNTISASIGSSNSKGILPNECFMEAGYTKYGNKAYSLICITQ